MINSDRCPFNLRVKKSVVINLLFFIALSFTCSRGLLEIFISKKLAYLVQSFMWVFFIFNLVSLSRLKKTMFFLPAQFVFLFFILVAILSGLATYLTSGFTDFGYYLLVNIYFSVMFFIAISLKCNLAENIRYERILPIIAFILLMIASLQQLNIIYDFPGLSWVSGITRPASLSGSYLHYPLIMSLLGFMMLEIYQQTRKKKLFYMAIASFVGVFVSLSRSGNMIILFGLLFYILDIFSRGRSVKIKSRIINSFFLTVLIIAVVLFLLPAREIFVSRVANAFKASSEGNIERIEHWLTALNLWYESAFFVGSHTGLMTNVSKNFGISGASISESGFLQQLVNFGLLGTLFYYTILLMLFWRIHKEHLWLRAALFTSILQTFVYQSIEVFPFMILLSVFPFVSDALMSKERVKKIK